MNTGVAVGTAVARRPPHGSRRAELPHRALASGHNARMICTTRHTRVDSVGGYTRHCVRTRFATARFPLAGFLPSILSAAAGAPNSFVRELLRYYEPIRLPQAMHRSRAPYGFKART